MNAGNVLNTKDNNLSRVLYKLAKIDCQSNNAESAKLHKDAMIVFEAVYNDGDFRHSYSNIFGIVSAIYDDAELGDISVLQNNLSLLIKESKDKANGIDKQLLKLFDHISLDMSRIDYVERKYINSIRKDISDSEKNYKTLSKKTTYCEKQIGTIESKIIDTSNKIKDAQKNNIAILSIFAAVILSCAGGFTFTTSVLSNIHQASAYRITFAIIAIALVVINIFHALFGYLSEIISLTDNVKFSWVNCANKILCAILAILCLLWCCGAVEKRNTRILGNPQTAVQTQQKSSAK